MGFYHTVQQGEHVSSIAAEFGFLDYKVVWDDPNNAELKALRVNPNVLYPGDKLYIPDKQKKQELKATTKRHLFKLSKGQLALRLILKHRYLKPIAHANCTLYFNPQKFALTSDDDGAIEHEIPAGAKDCILAIEGDTWPYPVSIGALDPVDTLTGQTERLNNLGYAAGSPKDASDPDFTSALEEFQCDQKLTVDGHPNAQTQSQLKQVHGC